LFVLLFTGGAPAASVFCRADNEAEIPKLESSVTSLTGYNEFVIEDSLGDRLSDAFLYWDGGVLKFSVTSNDVMISNARLSVLGERGYRIIYDSTPVLVGDQTSIGIFEYEGEYEPSMIFEFLSLIGNNRDFQLDLSLSDGTRSQIFFTATVPESSTLSLIPIAGIILARRKRRKGEAVHPITTAQVGRS
jgi:hypothetical protein